MNNIILKGIIKDIKYSHNIQDIEYYKGNLLVPRDNGKEDIINIKFKRFSCDCNEGDTISLKGNVRTFNHKENDKNKVDIFCFTYFDKPEEEINNKVELDGVICKINNLKKTYLGKDVCDFIIVNSIDKLHSYLPCVAWGKQAKEIAKLPIGTKISIEGELRSREYKKYTDEVNFDIKIAHEINVKSFNCEKHIEI